MAVPGICGLVSYNLCMCRLDSLRPLREDGIETAALDVTCQDSIAACLAHITAIAGPLHVLINNAGTSCLLHARQAIINVETLALFNGDGHGDVGFCICRHAGDGAAH